MIKFPSSAVNRWLAFRNSPEGHDDRKNLRVGQSFFNWFECHKVTSQDRVLLDKLYELDGTEARQIISLLTDHEQ